MSFEILNAENYLTSPDVIINSEGRFLCTHCWPVFADTLPYEMLLLRPAYAYGDIELGNNRFGRIEKYLDFKTFYDDWDDRTQARECRIEIERYTEMAEFLNKWIEENKSILLEQCEYDVALEFFDKVNKNREIISAPSYDLKSRIFTYEYEDNSSFALKDKYSLMGFDYAWTKYVRDLLKKEELWLLSIDIFPYE